jgi:hypothetical protein
MSVEAWGILIGVVVSALLALGPWMFMVHAKLAVVSVQLADLTEKLDRLACAHQQRLAMCIHHEARLETTDVQIAHMAERLRDLQEEQMG